MDKRVILKNLEKIHGELSRKSERQILKFFLICALTAIGGVVVGNIFSSLALFGLVFGVGLIGSGYIFSKKWGNTFNDLIYIESEKKRICDEIANDEKEKTLSIKNNKLLSDDIDLSDDVDKDTDDLNSTDQLLTNVSSSSLSNNIGLLENHDYSTIFDISDSDVIERIISHSDCLSNAQKDGVSENNSLYFDAYVEPIEETTYARRRFFRYKGKH